MTASADEAIFSTMNLKGRSSSWGRVAALALLATALSVPYAPAVAGSLCAIPATSGAIVYTNMPTNEGRCASTSVSFSGREMTLTGSSASEPRFDSMIRNWASRYNVSPSLVHAVVSTESAYNPGAVSPKGARGLMQLMPQTAKQYGVTNSFDADQNIRGGVALLRDLLDTYGGDTRLAVAAYNAGAGAVNRYSGVPPFAETKHYVRSVLGKMRASGSAVGTGSGSAIKVASSPIVKRVGASGVVSFAN